MRRIIPVCAIAVALTAGLAAQDQTVTSRTKVKADEATVASMTGCLRQDASGRYTLTGTIARGGDDLKTRTKVETDVDRDDTEVTATTRTRTDDGAVGTSGTVATFSLVPRGGVNLSPHVGRRVQISAVMVDPDHKDADVTIEEKTTTDPDDARDTTQRSKTEIEVDRSARGQYTVVSVTPLDTACTL